MLAATQPIYPASQFSMSMPNRTSLQVARNTFEYLRWFGDDYPAGADGTCVMFTAGARIGLNSSMLVHALTIPEAMYIPLMPNLMTSAQIGPALAQFLNELFLMSHEGFIRFFNGHFSSMHPDAPIPQQSESPTNSTNDYFKRRPWLGSSFERLRAQGAFLVSGAMEQKGLIGNFTILSEKGSDFVWLDVFATLPKEFPVVYQFQPNSEPMLPVKVTEVHFNPEEAAVDGRIFRFATVPDQEYLLVAP